jgi:restriction endonuclease S subunit
MNTKVSYGALAPAMIGGLGIVVNALLEKARRGEAPVSLKRLSDVIKFSDSGIWGDNSLDPDVEPRIFRVSDFDGDFRLNYSSAPPRAIAPGKLAKFQLRRGDILVVKSSGSAKQVVSGRVAVFDTDSEQAYAASNFTLRLRPSADTDPHYLAFVLGSPPVREAVADSVKTMTYPNLSFRIYSAIEVPVIPLADQKLVGAFFNALLNKRELPTLPSYLREQRRVVPSLPMRVRQLGGHSLL